MFSQRIVVRNLDLLYRIPGFLILAVFSDYLTKVAGKILSSEFKREGFSTNSVDEGNHTTVDHGNTESNFHVPHASIILLSLLGLCLIVLFIMFILLRRCQSRLMDQLSGKGRSFSYSQVDSGSPESGHKDAKVPEKDYELYPLSPTEKRVKEDVYQRPPPLRAAVLQVTVSFLSTTGRLVVEIERLKSVAKKLLRSGFATSVEIHARLLPLPDKFRYKTSSKSIYKAEFHERFAFDGFINDDLRKCWFRFRLYSQRRLGKRGKLIGQVNVGVTDFEIDGVWSTLNLDVFPSEDVHKLLSSQK